MTIIHTLSRFADGGLSGVQAAQRDWSPYVVHFTEWAAMESLRSAVTDGLTPTEISRELAGADARSFATVQRIHKSGALRAHSPSQKDGILSCVCLSECSIPGLVSHSERFGRFGFVFRKADIYARDGGPCMYLSAAEYTEIVHAFKDRPPGPQLRLFSRANVYRPPGAGQVQDFSHEREWRVFHDIEFSDLPPALILTPMRYVDDVSRLFPKLPILPLDTLFDWGA